MRWLIETRDSRDPVSGDVRVEAFAVFDNKDMATFSVHIPYIATENADYPAKLQAAKFAVRQRLAQMLGA